MGGGLCLSVFKGTLLIQFEPELEGDVEGLAAHGHGSAGLVLCGGRQGGDVAHHVGVTDLVAGRLGQLVPDVEPI